MKEIFLILGEKVWPFDFELSIDKIALQNYDQDVFYGTQNNEIWKFQIEELRLDEIYQFHTFYTVEYSEEKFQSKDKYTISLPFLQLKNENHKEFSYLYIRLLIVKGIGGEKGAINISFTIFDQEKLERELSIEKKAHRKKGKTDLKIINEKELNLKTQTSFKIQNLEVFLNKSLKIDEFLSAKLTFHNFLREESNSTCM